MTKRECLRKIYEVIESKKELFLTSSSFLNGSPGVLLFLVYYRSLAEDERADSLIKEISGQLLAELSLDNIRYSDGLCGILWVLNHLEEEFGLNFKLDQFVHHFKNELQLNSGELRKQASLDFLHGILGLQFTIDQFGKNELSLLTEKLVFEKAIKTKEGTYWIEEMGSDEGIINTSLAHGQASIISYLADRHQQLKGKEKRRVESLLKAAIQYYETIELVDSISIYPSYIKPNQFSTLSRLAWCYGDLSIACALLYCSKILEDPILNAKAIGIAINTTSRKSEEETGIKDLGFCHGSAGVSHLYSYLYRHTGIEVFANASEYWLRYTLSRLFKDEFNYKAYRVDEGWQESYGLLDGLTGIGLTLLCNIYPTYTNWEEAFYLKSNRDGKTRNTT